MRAAVVTFPGSNGDYDLYKAARQVGFDTDFVWHRERGLEAYDVVLLPGGFSYGDYLRVGAIARMSPIMEDVIAFAHAGGPVLGICNGFQTLCEAALLPGALVRNDVLRFQGMDVRIRVERTDLPFTREYDEGQLLTIPIAHGDGNYEADAETLERLEGEDRVVFRYVDRDGNPTEGANPNGSWHNIAGITNEAGNVLGMMPHPERAMESLLGSDDGVALFSSLAAGVSVLSSSSPFQTRTSDQTA